MIFFGETRVPFDRPVQATAGFNPRSLDTGFIPTEFDPFPTVMLPRLARLPSGVHQPLQAEPGGAPQAPSGAEAMPAEAPPSPAKIKRASMRLIPPHLTMALGIFARPRRGNVRSGLDPSKLVKAGRNPGA